MASRRARIVLLRPSDGMELCTLVKVDPERRTTFDVEVTPDGRTVYFSDDGLGGCSTIYAVAIARGDVRVVARGGYTPAVSPDGGRLAYDASHSCGDRRHRIVVRDLATGSEREWIGTWEGGYGGLRWSHDPRFLLVAQSGADSARYFLLDIRRAGPLEGRFWPAVAENSEPVGGVPIGAPGVTLTDPTVHPVARTVAFGVAYSSVDGSEPYPLLEFDPRRGAWRVLISGGAWPIDYDATGRNLLFFRRGTKLKLYRYTGGRTFFLGKGFHDASW